MNAIVWGRWVARLLQQRRAGVPQARRRLAVETLEDRVTPATFIWIICSALSPEAPAFSCA